MQLGPDDWRRSACGRLLSFSLLLVSLLILLEWICTEDQPYRPQRIPIPDRHRPLDAIRCRDLLRTPDSSDRLREAALIRLARLTRSSPSQLWLQLAGEQPLDPALAVSLVRVVTQIADGNLRQRLANSPAETLPTASPQHRKGSSRADRLSHAVLLAADLLLHQERSTVWRDYVRNEAVDNPQTILTALRLVPAERLSRGQQQRFAKLVLACVRSDWSRPGMDLAARLPVVAVPETQRGRLVSWFVAELASGRAPARHPLLRQACLRFADGMTDAKRRRLLERLRQLQ